MKFAAIIFAGGEGMRMGGPKALLALDGVPLALLQAERFIDVGAACVVIAAPAHAATIVERALERLVERPDSLALRRCVYITSVETKEPRETILLAYDEAIRVANERSSSAPLEFCFIHPIDAGIPKKATLERLLATVREGDAASPSYDKRSGHPVLLRAAVLARLRDAAHLRELLQRSDVVRSFATVDDPDVLLDIDTPGDFERVYGARPQFLSEP